MLGLKEGSIGEATEIRTSRPVRECPLLPDRPLLTPHGGALHQEVLALEVLFVLYNNEGTHSL